MYLTSTSDSKCRPHVSFTIALVKLYIITHAVLNIKCVKCNLFASISSSNLYSYGKTKFTL